MLTLQHARSCRAREKTAETDTVNLPPSVQRPTRLCSTYFGGFIKLQADNKSAFYFYSLFSKQYKKVTPKIYNFMMLEKVIKPGNKESAIKKKKSANKGGDMLFLKKYSLCG